MKAAKRSDKVSEAPSQVSGLPDVGPESVMPAAPAVLVLTPSIGFGPASISST
jgi:hypothetical protein